MSPEPWRIVFFTLQMAAASTLLIVPPGVFVAWALSRPGWPGRVLVETVITLPLVLPPTAVGFGLLVLLGQGGPIGARLAGHPGLQIAFTWRGVVLASGVVAFPLLVRAFRTALEEVDPALLAVSRTLGRGPFGAFLAVQLPIAWRGLAAGVLLAFARALGEFGATVLLAGNIPGRTQTLALALFQFVQVGRQEEALRLAGVSAALAFLVLLVVERLSRRRARRLDL